MHGGAWWATHHGVAKSQTQLSTAPGYVFGKAESPNLKRYAHPTWRQPKWPLTDESAMIVGDCNSLLSETDPTGRTSVRIELDSAAPLMAVD